jgi:AhpD family alkylhydroperoxidase
MKQRMKMGDVEPRAYKAMNAAEEQLATFDLDPKLMELVRVRASQLNGCGYCINMHTKDARKLGETEQRLYAVSAWWETPFFTEAEQVALKLAEEITMIHKGGLSDATYEKAVEIFGKQQTAQLIFTVIVVNSWNRIAVSMHNIPGQG